MVSRHEIEIIINGRPINRLQHHPDPRNVASCRPAQVSASPEVPRTVTQSVTSLESLVRSADTLNEEEINSFINNFIFVPLSK